MWRPHGILSISSTHSICQHNEIIVVLHYCILGWLVKQQSINGASQEVLIGSHASATIFYSVLFFCFFYSEENIRIEPYLTRDDFTRI